MNKSQEALYRQSNMDKLRGMGKDKVRELMATSLISTGSFKGMNREEIAKATSIDYNDRDKMKHIETQLNRHDLRESK